MVQETFHHLRSVTATPHAHTDVHVRETVRPEQKHGLECLHSKDCRFQQLDGAPIHLDESTPTLAVGNRGGGLLLKQGRK